MPNLDLLSEERWLDYWRNYKGEAHQTEALLDLRLAIMAARPGLMGVEASWARKFSNRPLTPRPAGRKVRYQRQTDSQIPGMADRMCFSSTMAMFANYYRPTLFTAPNSDDQYLRMLQAKNWSSSDSSAHVRLMKSLGIPCKFVTNCTWARLIDETAKGNVVATGWYHNGPATEPRHDHGHWSLVAEATPAYAIHYDPNGEADLINGGYTQNMNGERIKYSRKNWGPRWLADGPTSGWAMVYTG